MLRIHSDVNRGWTTLQRSKNSQRLSDMINKHIEIIPASVYLSHQSKSLCVVTSAEIVNIHILKQGLHRDDEHCEVEQYEYTCWRTDKVCIWGKKCKNPESYGCTSYFEEQCDQLPVGDGGSRLVQISGTPRMRRISKKKKHAKVCCEQNCTSRIVVTNFVVTVVANATRATFTSDRTVTRYTEKSAFSTPRAVNICYTGTVNGKIEQTAISAEMNQAKKKGPCGSEIHIDTSMGVMQIFGNNGGSRKITCKAFLNIGEADFIVDRVCAMVSSLLGI